MLILLSLLAQAGKAQIRDTIVAKNDKIVSNLDSVYLRYINTYKDVGHDTVAIVPYENGINRDSVRLVFFKDGKHVKAIIDIAQGKPHGIYYEFNAKGDLIISGGYRYSKKSLDWIYYKKIGNRYFIDKACFYENDKLNGASTIFYTTPDDAPIGYRKIKISLNYKNGFLHGEQYYFRKDETLEKKEFYDNGTYVGTIYYNTDGGVIKKVTNTKYKGTIKLP